MKILAIDTSSLVATVAVVEEQKLLGEYVLNHKKTHSQTLMPMIEGVLKDLEIDVQDLDGIAVAKGPGSFTGLRIGAATAKGLAFAISKPLIGISTLEGLAHNLPFAKHLICPIMDAKRNEVYTALYRWKKGKCVEKLTPKAMSIQEILYMLKSIDKKVIFIGDGVPVYEEKIKEILGDRACFAPSSCNMQKASSIAAIALEKAKHGLYEDVYTFVPTYLRKSQAEREYEEKHGQSVES